MSRISVRAIIALDGKYLLVRQKSSNNGAFWCLPGGGVEEGEDILSALTRELVEETGIEPIIGNLLFVHQIKDVHGYDGVGFYFQVTNGADYLHLDIAKTTHGNAELFEADYVDIQTVHVLPTFLKTKLPELSQDTIHGPTQIMLTDNEE